MTMGEIIRRLRREQGVTQEMLAEYLGITYQAVSKWENNTGLPDISLIVPLSNFFGVSPDVLFGWTAETERADVQRYHEQSAEAMKNGTLDEELKLWRAASEKYPKNYTCMQRLMAALYLSAVSGKIEEGRTRDDMLTEALELGQRILDDCRDEEIAGSARQLMVYICSDEQSVCFDREKAVEALQTLVRFKTVSYSDSSLEDDAEFEGLVNELPELYPNVFRVCEVKKLPDRALLFKWKGQKSESPVVLMAHYDVVPVLEDSWQKPPFEAIIEDGVLWGRGTLDTKVTFNAIVVNFSSEG